MFRTRTDPNPHAITNPKLLTSKLMTKLIFSIRRGPHPAIYLSAAPDPGFAIILEVKIYISFPVSNVNLSHLITY
jgi:hypothetical protein